MVLLPFELRFDRPNSTPLLHLGYVLKNPAEEKLFFLFDHV